MSVHAYNFECVYFIRKLFTKLLNKFNSPSLSFALSEYLSLLTSRSHFETITNSYLYAYALPFYLTVFEPTTPLSSYSLPKNYYKVKNFNFFSIHINSFPFRMLCVAKASCQQKRRQLQNFHICMQFCHSFLSSVFFSRIFNHYL